MSDTEELLPDLELPDEDVENARSSSLQTPLKAKPDDEDQETGGNDNHETHIAGLMSPAGLEREEPLEPGSVRDFESAVNRARSLDQDGQV